LGTYQQAVLVLRWYLDDTRMSALARDNGIAVSTAYDYRDEGIAILAARRPSLREALLAAKAAGHSHVIVDGTLIHTVRIRVPGPTPGVDLWWSGKHCQHSSNVQVVSAPDGWPLWTSDVRPGREHDISAARADPELLAHIADWISDGALALADLSYEGEPETFTIPIKKPTGGHLSVDQRSCNAVHGALRCSGDRANALLKITYKVLRYCGCPRRIGDIVAATLVPLHHEHGRTTLLSRSRSHNTTKGYAERSVSVLSSTAHRQPHPAPIAGCDVNLSDIARAAVRPNRLVPER
jgi:hypothetical protein